MIRKLKPFLPSGERAKFKKNWMELFASRLFFEHIAKKLQEQGCDRDWKQCRAKVKNLKTKYRESKDNNNKTGRGRQTCKFYRELDGILGHRPASVPSALLDTGESCPAPESEAESDEEGVNGKLDKLNIKHTLTCIEMQMELSAGTLSVRQC